MTLEEAISYVEEVAEKNEKKYKEKPLIISNKEEFYRFTNYNCKKRAEEHRQIAEWLKDYKRLKEAQPCEDAIKSVVAESEE